MTPDAVSTTPSLTRILAFLCVSLMGPLHAADAPIPKPNFLILIADDLARSELGCYGGKNVATPNIDRLASQGLRFNQAINSMAMCAPMRAAVYTGLYPMRNGVTHNHAATIAPKTVAHYLKERGYRVGQTGKKHFGPKSAYPFEDVAGFEPNCVALTADYSLAGIKAFMTRDTAEPFCLFVCLVLPHAPWTVGDPSKFPPEKLVFPPHWADTPKMRQAFSKYCAEVDMLDRQVGEIARLVDGLKLAANTLLVFSGEQGPQFPRAKWTNYDHGLASAFIARWPGRVQAGATTEAIIQYEDLVPTLIELSGGTPPQELDGRSFAGVLSGAKSAHRDYAFAMHNNIPEGRPYPIRAIRDTRYKLILNLTPDADYHEKHMMDIDREDYWHSWVEAAKTDPKAAEALRRFTKRPPVELYDVRSDPWELENLAEKPALAATREAMEKRLRDWMKQQGDPGAALDFLTDEQKAVKWPGRDASGEPKKKQRKGKK
jgi:arylsulfatase A-like enzyme